MTVVERRTLSKSMTVMAESTVSARSMAVEYPAAEPRKVAADVCSNVTDSRSIAERMDRQVILVASPCTIPWRAASDSIILKYNRRVWRTASARREVQMADNQENEETSEKPPEIPPEAAKAMREKLKMVEAAKRIKHKIVVMSGKGGVGKSTVAAGLACALARGSKVGILDADVTGPDIPLVMGVDDKVPKGSEEAIQPVEGPLGIKIISMAQLLPDKDAAVIWRGPMKIQVLRQIITFVDWGDLDYLVIDLPPGTSDEPLSISQEIPDIDGAVIVTTPQELSLLDVRKSINFAKAVKMRILGVVENMSGYTCPECGHKEPLFKTGGGKKMAEQLGIPFLGSIPIDPSIVTGGDAGKPFVLENPDSEATKAFEVIVENLKSEVARIAPKAKFKPVGT